MDDLQKATRKSAYSFQAAEVSEKGEDVRLLTIIPHAFLT